jgi:hypothetical protein
MSSAACLQARQLSTKLGRYMKVMLRLTSLIGQPPSNIATHFITPTRVVTSDESWCAKIFWGRYDSKKPGDLLELEFIFPTAPRPNVGDVIEIFGGSGFTALGEVVNALPR